MKLNKNSTNAKLYRWFYQKDEMPRSLCPYFWKLVIAWVFGLPLAIITIPAMIIYGDFSRNVESEDDYENCSYGKSRTEQSTRIFGSFIIYGMLFVAICMLVSISLFWYVFPKKSFLYQLQVGGALSWIVVLVAGLVFGVRYLWVVIKERKKNREGVKMKGNNIVSEFVKAKYNRYCPKIDWE